MKQRKIHHKHNQRSKNGIPSLIPGKKSAAVAREAVLFEEFCDQQEIKLEFKPIAPKVLVHGHCHQKAFSSTNLLIQTLKMVPGLEVERLFRLSVPWPKVLTGFPAIQVLETVSNCMQH
jgi:hypothetical protein